ALGRRASRRCLRRRGVGLAVVLILTACVSVLVAVLTVGRLRIVLALLIAVPVLALRLAGRSRWFVVRGRVGRGSAEPEGSDHARDQDDALHRVPPVAVRRWFRAPGPAVTLSI